MRRLLLLTLLDVFVESVGSLVPELLEADDPVCIGLRPRASRP